MYWGGMKLQRGFASILNKNCIRNMYWGARKLQRGLIWLGWAKRMPWLYCVFMKMGTSKTYPSVFVKIGTSATC
jgi:hypothetical protein